MITRKVAGRGDSPYLLNNVGAAERAKERARVNLNRTLEEAIEPVPCPACGVVFQPDMVRILHDRYGKQYEPNKYASERIAVPVVDAWLAARAANTIESYTKFMEIWPAAQDGINTSELVRPTARTFNRFAKDAIKELKYPSLLRKFSFNIFWVIWGVIILLFIILVFITMMRR
ncbi:MAG: hypothetical protein ACLP8A_07620 [Methylovirgula sp.]